LHLEESGLSAEEVLAVLDALAAVASPVEPAFRWRGTLPDEDDAMVLEAAVSGGADAIVTFNKRDFAPVRKQFGIAVWSPGEALRRLENEL
jgi:predicted nucleic acid-binding protein